MYIDAGYFIIVITIIFIIYFQGLLHYHVTNPNTSWKILFTTMEKMKADYNIVEDYTISETTLEQVFLSFAKKQTEEIII